MEAKDPFDCARVGDVDFFKTVDLEILLKAREENGQTVLTVATIFGHLDCCEVIVERCTPLLYNQLDVVKCSVLHLVACHWEDNNHENIMRFLITADSKPDLERGGGGAKLPNYRLLTMKGEQGYTALHVAVEEGNHGATKLLLEADRDLELLRMVDEDGRTCLHIAAERGDLESAELILKTRPDSDFLKMTESKSNQTAVHVAVRKGNVEMVKLIWEADPDKQLLSMPDSHGNTPLHLAVRNNNLEIVRFLYQMVDMEAKDAITCARVGDVNFFKAVAREILLQARDECYNTVLTVAAIHGHLDCCKVIVERCTPLLYLRLRIDKRSVLHEVVASSPQDNNLENIMRFLLFTADSKPDLERGGGPKLPNNSLLTMQDSDGRTALHLAVRYANHGATKLLLEADLDQQLPSMPDSQGNTPLHLAVRNNNLEIVTLLIEGDMVVDYGANNSKQTPLLLAISKIAQDGSGSDSEEICNLLLMRKSSQCTKQTGDMGRDMRWTPLHYAVSYGFISVVEEISRLCPNYIWAEDSHGQIPYMIATRRVLSDEREKCLKSDLEIIRILLEKDSKQCTKLEDKHDQPFIHVAVKLGLNDVVETILKTKEMEATILNIQDKDGNTPLHIAALGENKRMTLCLLYDERVSKGIENNKKEKAIDLINFPYDEAKARVYSLGHQSDLKDQSSFDLLVAALIATVSFTAGLTVPGGYVSDGVNKGSAILLKATAFKVFVVSNNIALLFSLYTVFLNFSTRRLLKKGDIYYESKTGTFRTRLLRKTDDMIYSLNAATLCTLSAIYAMVVAFITGSYAVLANSDGLAIIVCVSSSFFLILASHATWTMAMQYWHSKPVPEVSS